MLKVAIVAGGDSGEYDVSVGSGRQVLEHLDRKLFVPYLVEISKNGWYCLVDGRKIPVDKNDFSVTINDEKITFDVVFNAIHGTPGENGLLTGYFDMLTIPYTSSGVTTSALTFNKSFCKLVVGSTGVSTAKSVHLFRKMSSPKTLIMDELNLPVFVKPNNGGSSVGMSKVNHPEDLDAALEKAFREDDELLVEEFISGRELTCGVLCTDDEIIALPVTEVVSKKEFFDYEAKYSDGLAQEIVPADISEEVSNECREISRMLYAKLNCRGVVRFDYILSEGTFYFLEVNTVPGLSAQSIVPKMAKAYGWDMQELFTRLIRSAMGIEGEASFTGEKKGLVFATNNIHKLREVTEICGNRIEVKGLREAGFEGEIPEDQDTIEGNAIQKARYIYAKTGKDCFADDTGLFIEALEGRPGVYSARYAGENCTFEDNINKVLDELKGETNRKAEFRCVICLIQKGKEQIFEGTVKGRILEAKKGTSGFGYDPVFLPDGQKQTFSEMAPYLKNGLSHRGKAVSKMLRYLGF